jgi:hypothetical protein
MPPTLELTQDDKYGLEPANVPAATGVTDDKYGLEPAQKAEPSEQERLGKQTPAGIAPMKAQTETQFEKENKPIPYAGFTPSHLGSEAWRGLKELGSGVASMVGDIPSGASEFLSKNVVVPGEAEHEKAAKAWEELQAQSRSTGRAPIEKILPMIGHEAASQLPVVGPWAAGLGEQAGSGDIGGAAARGGTQAVAAEVAKPIAKVSGRMAGAFREGVGGAIHDPVTGELTKGTEALSRGAGTVIGGTSGAGIGSLFGPRGTYAGGAIGATAGSLAGPALMERIFPEPAARIAGREEFAKTKTLTEAQEAAIKENTARQNAARVESERLQKAADKARQDAEDARNQHAEDLMRRQREQDKLDDEANRAAREAKAARDRPFEQEAQARMRRQKEQDSLDKAAKKAADDAQAARNEHAEDLIRRQKEQDALDANHAKALKDLEGARQAELAANEKLKEQHAAALNKRGDVKKMTPPTETGGTPQGKPTPFSGPQDLITRTKKLVIPGEKPTPEELKRAGDMTQVPLPKLQLLAKWGDELAKNEINRRLRNEPDFSQAPLPKGGTPPTPVKPMTPPRIPVEQKLKTAGVKPWTDIASQTVSPEEVAEFSRQLGRPVTATEIPEIRSRLEAERNVAEGIAGNRRDVAGEIREEHRAKLEKGAGILPGMEGDVAKQAEGAAKVKGEELTAEMNKPRNVEEAAGRMETLSPLFRGTAASPQGELLKPMEKPTITEPEEEAEPAEIKGVTEPIEQPVKREAPPDVAKKYGKDEIEEAELSIQQEISQAQSFDRPGREPIIESREGNTNPNWQEITGWRGVTSSRHQMPWLNENPKFGVAQLEKALRNKDSALYKRAIDSMVQFNRRAKMSPEERAAAGEERANAKEQTGRVSGLKFLEALKKPKPAAD